MQERGLPRGEKINSSSQGGPNGRGEGEENSTSYGRRGRFLTIDVGGGSEPANQGRRGESFTEIGKKRGKERRFSFLFSVKRDEENARPLEKK